MIRVLCVLALLGRVAAADGKQLDKARDAVDRSEYSAARPLLVAALETGSNDPDQMIEIYRLTAIAAAALNDTRAATDAFTRLLALSPKFMLPAGTSPKITRPFVTAGTYYKSHDPLRVKAQTTAQPPAVALVIESDPLGMIVRARAKVRVDGKPAQELDGKGSGRIEIALPPGDKLEIELAALDEYGNRLVELGGRDAPIEIAGAREAETVVVKPPPPPKPKPKPLPPPVQAERAWYWQWWVWGTAAVAFGGGATYFGLAARSSIDELRVVQANSYTHEWHDAHDIESRARLQALAFNIGMGAAGVFAVGATILFMTRPQETITPVPTRGGVALVIGGTF